MAEPIILPNEADKHELARMRRKLDNIRGGPGILIANRPDGYVIEAVQKPQPTTPAGDSIFRFRVTSIPTEDSYSELVLARFCRNGVVNDEETETPIVWHQVHAVDDELLATRPIGGPTNGPYIYDGKTVEWEETSGSIPPGTGKYKVLMLIDDEDPGTAAWDYARFHE